jgi:hypothetical protein
MNVAPITTPLRRSRSRGLVALALAWIFCAALLAPTPARANELHPGNIYSLTLTDVDRQQLSTSDGHVTIITVLTRKDEEKAEQVGERVPHIYLGDPKYRLITVVNFQRGIFPIFQGMINAIIRNRMDAEAKELQAIYTSKHLTRNPRSDIFVVADFDGKPVSKLGIAATSSEFAVFVFDGHGRLHRRWNDVPSEEALAQALIEAR